jgi:competence protein ComEC
VAVPLPSAGEVALLYALLLPFLLATRRWQLGAAAALAGAAALVALASWNRPRGELRVTFLSVGQGDAAVVEFPGQRVLLVDAGGRAFGDFDPGEAIVAPFLRARKILRVDYLFVSTPRVDHYGGMRTIVQQFGPSEFWSGGRAAATRRYRELDDALDRAAVRRVSLSAKDGCRTIEGVRACVLYAPESEREGSSVVLRLEYGRASFLFLGDIGKKEEARLVSAQAPLASTVVKVPRHGSATSSSENLVAASAPRLAVVSVGDRNPFGLPREEVLARYRARGAAVLRTDEDGAIAIETDGRTLRYRTYRSQKRGSLLLAGF